MSDNNDDGIKRKFPTPLPRKKIAVASRLSLIVATGLLTLTAYASDVSVRDIQLLLALEGYELDAKSIDGKLGPVTRAAIRDYRKKKNLSKATNDDELIDDALFDSLSEDTNTKFFSSPKRGEDQGPAKEKSTSEPASDVNSKTVDVYASAIAAIYAARHSTEETKDFYETFTSIVAILAVLGTLFGFKSLKDVKSDLRKEIKKEIRVEKIGIKNVRKEYQGINKEINDLSSQMEKKIKDLDETLNETVGLSKFTHWILAETFNAYVRVTDYIRNPSSDQSRAYVDSAIEKTKEIIEKYESKSEAYQAKILKYVGAEQIAWTYNIYGTGQVINNDIPEAYKSLKRATELNPKGADALYNFACAATRSEKYDEALHALGEAVSINKALARSAWNDPDMNNLRTENYLTQFIIICGEDPDNSTTDPGK